MKTKFNIHHGNGYLLFVLLAVVGLLGNYFKFSLFLNVDFIFGSIFALLCLQFLGAMPALLSSVMISSVTYILWNHPYAIIIMTAEVATVAFLIRKKKMGLVLADVLYWIFIGMPLIYCFYHLVMHVEESNLYIFMIKQSINGIANALLARLLFSICVFRNKDALISYRDTIYNLLAFFVLIPSLIIISISARSDFERINNEIKMDLARESDSLHSSLKYWIYNRQTAISNLAAMASSRSPKEMQEPMEQAVKADVNFFRIGLHDKNATVIGHFPLKDELGQSTIGKSFADRPYIPIIKKELRPFLTEVVKSRIGRPYPVISTITPIVKKGEFNGYVIGVLNLAQVLENLDKAADHSTLQYALLDRNGNVIVTNFKDQKPLQKFDRGDGEWSSLNFFNVKEWVPRLPANTPASERWKKSFFIAESTIGENNEWKLILEQPIAPFQKALNKNYFYKMLVLFFILLVSLFSAELLSRKLIFALEELNFLTNDLPQRLAFKVDNLPWPKTGFTEARELVGHFKTMARSLSMKFHEIKQINESLEQRVEARTRDLNWSAQQLLMAQKISHTGSWSYDVGSDVFYASAEGMKIFGYQAVAGTVSVDDVFSCIPEADRIKKSLFDLIERDEPYDVEFSIVPKNNEAQRMVHSIATMEKDKTGKPIKVLGFLEDITERHKRLSNMRFLAQTGAILSESLETDEMIKKIAGLITNELADGCLIRLFKDDGSFDIKEIAHKDQKKKKCFNALVESFENKKYLPVDVLMVMQKQTVIIHQNFHEKLLGDVALSDDDKNNIRTMGTFSTALIPLRGQSQTIGMLRFISHEGSQSLDESDTSFLETIGNRLALSIENARLYAETRRAVKTREEILAIVSHDLRNPLSAIQMSGQLLPKLVKDDERVSVYAHKILRSTAQMQRMIDDLMDFAKIQAGTLSIERKMESPVAIIESVNEIMRPLAEEKGLHYTSSIDGPFVEIYCDKQRLVQALLNIVGNAIKFTESQGSVQLSLIHTLEGVTFSVSDTGPGISKVDLPKIFDRYWQAHRSKKSSTGLGLSITKAIVDAHQGTITVQSEVGVGTTFSFVIS